VKRVPRKKGAPLDPETEKEKRGRKVKKSALLLFAAREEKRRRANC